MRRTTLIPLSLLLLTASCTNSTDPGDAGLASSVAPEETTNSSPATTAAVDPASSFAPEPHPAAGIWYAELGPAILQFRLDQDADGTITGVFDSVTEGVTDIPVTVGVDDPVVTIEIPVAAAVFEGQVAGDELSGVWQQAGSELPLVFARQDEPFSFDRPQEPVPPFPYTTTDVTFGTGGITLAGTLTVPHGSGPFPAAVLISGSGQQDRDETLMGHKPFLVLADHLARAGVATLRYDDRGVGGSTGNPLGATTADFADDAGMAVVFLMEREEIGDIGLIGHSEGGLIAPMVAAAHEETSFVVLLAGPGMPGAEVLSTQTEDLLRAEGASISVSDWQVNWTNQVIAISASAVDDTVAGEQIRSVMTDAADTVPPAMAAAVTDEGVSAIVTTYTDPWMRYFLSYDPRPALQALEIPVLAAIGSLDLQVSAPANLPELERALSGNNDATVVEMSGLNHLFQTATTGAVSEYGSIEETLSPDLLELVGRWITDRF